MTGLGTWGRPGWKILCTGGRAGARWGTALAATCAVAVASAPETTCALASSQGTAVCIGDCDDSGDIAINELVSMVAIALGQRDIGACPPGDANGDAVISINEIISAVDRALHGCETIAPAPLVGEALDCRRDGGAGALAPGDGLFRVDINNDTYPNALCNDGTPAVFYVRRASRAEDTNRWMIYLQGGGNCSSEQQCADRWCSVGTSFGSLKMSSDGAPPRGSRAAGIQRRSADNPFAGWNQVHIYYCSSDSWSGTHRDAPVVAEHPTRGTPVEFRMHFLGAEIFDAAVDMLRRGQGESLQYTDDTGASLEMPDLDQAENVVLAGSSAGSAGVQNNLDHLATLLRDNHERCSSDGSLAGSGSACPLEVNGLLDAGLSPDREKLDYSTSLFCSDAGLCSWEQHMRAVAATTHGSLWLSRGDESCRSWHPQNLPGSMWQCADLGHIMRHHLTTPFFVRQDQADSLIGPNTVEVGYSVPSQGGAVLNQLLFAQLVAEDLAALADVQATAHEGTQISVVPGTYGPRCGNHESLRNNPATYDVTIEVGGVVYTTVEIFSNWLRGLAPVSAIAADSENFSCP